jgi:hypothetical protein
MFGSRPLRVEAGPTEDERAAHSRSRGLASDPQLWLLPREAGAARPLVLRTREALNAGHSLRRRASRLRRGGTGKVAPKTEGRHRATFTTPLNSVLRSPVNEPRAGAGRTRAGIRREPATGDGTPLDAAARVTTTERAGPHSDGQARDPSAVPRGPPHAGAQRRARRAAPPISRRAGTSVSQPSIDTPVITRIRRNSGETE